MLASTSSANQGERPSANQARPCGCPATTPGIDMTVNELALTFWEHAKLYYVKPNGEATGEQQAGGCPSQSEATCRIISVALRSGVDPTVLIEQLKGIRCLSTCLARKDRKDVTILSCPDAIANALEEACTSQAEPSEPGESLQGRPCPHCGEPMRREAMCSVCDRCQYNSCG